MTIMSINRLRMGTYGGTTSNYGKQTTLQSLTPAADSPNLMNQPFSVIDDTFGWRIYSRFPRKFSMRRYLLPLAAQ